MGARLQFAKVIDQDLFYMRGGKVHPGLENHVVINEEPGKAAAFYVLRGWCDDRGTFTEHWRIEDPGGMVLYESIPRELHLPNKSHVERLQDEISDLDIEYAAEDYVVRFFLDEHEVALVQFPVRRNGVPELQA